MNHLYASIMLFMIAVITGSIVFSSQMRLWKKATIILALSFSGMLTYRAMNSAYGYSAILQQSLKGVMILGHYPDKTSGVIHIWIVNPEDNKPRTYTMPFSAKTAKALDGKRKQSRGKPYKLDIMVKSNKLNRFKESVEEVRLYDYKFDGQK